MKYEEKTIESSEIYKGKVLDLRLEKVMLANGDIAQREIISHGGACAIVVVNGDKIIFVRQFRKAIEKELLEIPAGKLDKNEIPDDCVRRELKEETGYTANNLTYLGKIYTTPGFSNEVIHIYFTNNITPGEISRDPDEFMDIEEYSIYEVFKMISEGKIYDSKTLSALFLAYNHIKR